MNKNKFRLKFFLICLSFLGVFISVIYGAVPMKINYQGYLEESGMPVNGNKEFVFKIYDVASGGSPIWSSQLQVVNIVNGVFSVILQGGTPVLSNNTFNGMRYLEIIVGGGNFYASA